MTASGASSHLTRRGALELLRLAHPAGSTAVVALHGAHVTSFVPAGGAEALFVSEASAWERGTAIRGGIPVIFPQFAGLGPLTKHGFARTTLWRIADAREPDRATLRLAHSPETRAVWPHPFAAELTVTLGARTLEVMLVIANAGEAPLAFTAALHTYVRVGDVRQASLEGLRGVRYRSGVEGVDGRIDEAPALVVGGEVDRTYLEAPGTLVVHDPALGRDVRLDADGFSDAVVWNPWVERSRTLPDMRGDEYLRMLCVEAAQVGTPVSLAPGGRWRGAQRIGVHGLSPVRGALGPPV